MKEKATPLSLLLILLIVMTIGFLELRDKKTEVGSSHSKSERSIASHADNRALASQFNKDFPIENEVAQSVTYQGSNFEGFAEIKAYYQLSEKKYQLGNQRYYMSKFHTIEKTGPFDKSLGKLIEEKFGYYIFLPQKKTTQTAALLVSDLTYLPTIMTGNLFLTYDSKSDLNYLQKALESQEYAITQINEDISTIYLKVKKRSSVIKAKNKLQQQFPNVQISVELKDSEQVPF